jgi:hypothetical protein
MGCFMPIESESSAPAASTSPRMFCKKCGYALVGLESRVCPECGRGFDPSNRRTFATRPPRGRAWRWGKRLAALVLLLMLVVGAGIGWLWWGWHAEQPTIARLGALHQQFTVAPIGPERLQWLLGTRWGYLAERVDRVDVVGLKAADTEALDLGSLSQIQTLWLNGCEMSPSTLSHLAGLRKLQALVLWGAKGKKWDLAFLEKLPALSSLGLSGDWVGQAGLEHVGRLKHLKVLRFYDAGLKDRDLQSLQGLSSLEELTFEGNSLSDAGLTHLQGLKSLRVLEIDDRLLGSPGVAKLKQALPGLRVVGFQ